MARENSDGEPKQDVQIFSISKLKALLSHINIKKKTIYVAIKRYKYHYFFFPLILQPIFSKDYTYLSLHGIDIWIYGIDDKNKMKKKSDQGKYTIYKLYWKLIKKYKNKKCKY